MRRQRQGDESGVAVLYIHALFNPGVSWGAAPRRRTSTTAISTTSQPLPANPGYDAIARRCWCRRAGCLRPRWTRRRSATSPHARPTRALQQAATSGQHDHPEGIFYGGRNPTWSHVTLRHVLQEHGRQCARLADRLSHWPGPAAWASVSSPAATMPRRWCAPTPGWGERITSIYDGSSTSALLTGLMWTVAYEECAQAEYTGIALKYGTVPVMEVLTLRADQWLENHPAGAAQREAIKQRMLAVFYTDTEAWGAGCARATGASGRRRRPWPVCTRGG